MYLVVLSGFWVGRLSNRRFLTLNLTVGMVYTGCRFCVTSGELTEEMIKEYLEHHFEPKVDDNFRTED